MDDGGAAPFLRLLEGLLSDSTLSTIYTTLLSPSSPVQLLKRHTISLLSASSKTLLPLLQPLLEKSTTFLHSSPDIVVLIALLTAFIIAIQILLFVRRLVAWGLRIVFRVAFWAVVVGLVSVVVRRGPERSLEDAGRVLGKLVGYAGAMREFWMKEYGRYEEQQRRAAARATATGTGGGWGGGRGW